MISAKDYLNPDVVNINVKMKNSLRYSSKTELDLKEQAKEGFPYEIVGFLLGKGDDVIELLQVENIAENKKKRFEIAPLDYMRAENKAIEKDLELLGIYHSHPNYPAIPSATDLSFAQEGFSYPIISVQNNGKTHINAWKLDGERFVEQYIKIEDEPVSD